MVEVEMKDEIFALKLVIDTTMYRETHFAVGCTSPFAESYPVVVGCKGVTHLSLSGRIGECFAPCA